MSGKDSLKLVSAIFYQIFISSPNDSPSKTEKCFLFHLKSSFRSRDIQIFVIFPLSTLYRFKRTNGSGIIYDVLIALYKFAGVTFGITQEPLYITPSNLV